MKTASTFAVGARGKPTEPRMAPLGASCCRAAVARLLKLLRLTNRIRFLGTLLTDAGILALLGATLAAAA